MIWLVILVLVIAAMLVGTVYLTAAVGRFAPIRRLPKRWQRGMLSFGMLALAFFAITLAMSLVNAIIVFLHALCLVEMA